MQRILWNKLIKLATCKTLPVYASVSFSWTWRIFLIFTAHEKSELWQRIHSGILLHWLIHLKPYQGYFCRHQQSPRKIVDKLKNINCDFNIKYLHTHIFVSRRKIKQKLSTSDWAARAHWKGWKPLDVSFFAAQPKTLESVLCSHWANICSLDTKSFDLSLMTALSPVKPF